MTNVLVVATDAVGGRMAGAGVRAWELSRALASSYHVTLAAPPPTPRQGDGFEVVEAARSRIDAALASADVVLLQPVALEIFPQLASTAARIVVDLYDPAVIEGLEFDTGEPIEERLDRHGRDLAALSAAARAGDLFLCASEVQRHYWLGVLSAFGRVNPLTYTGDPELNRLLRVVPFGLPERPPEPGPRRLRGAVPGIGLDDPIVIWAGGLWNWFDPETLIRATGAAVPAVPTLRLVFMGSGHPNPSVPRMATAAHAKAVADSLGLTGKHVFFLPDWVPYSERSGILLDATAGAVLQRRTVEATFAFRTRVLDHLWAGLPSLLTSGDALSELGEREGFAEVVPPADVAATSEALIRLTADRELAARRRTAALRVADEFRWSRVARPLVDYCGDPWPAADAGRRSTGAPSERARIPVRRSLRLLRREGPWRFALRAYRRLRRLAG